MGRSKEQRHDSVPSLKEEGTLAFKFGSQAIRANRQ